MGPAAQPVRHRPAPGPSAGPVKHRACDGCRSRKLACTKEPGGCARCERDDIRCHYSAQKPMGRPRKQRAVHPAGADAVHPHVFPPAPTAQDTTGAPVVADPAVATSMTDPALDADVADLDFLDLLRPDFLCAQPFDATKSTALGDPMAHSLGREVWKFDFDFDPHVPPPAGAGGDGGRDAAPRPFSPLPAMNTPSLSPGGISPPDVDYPLDPALSSSPTTTEADPPLQPVSCACLANLYLALDSTARLPTEVMPAMRVARGACKAAHDTLLCQTCCPPLLPDVAAAAAATPRAPTPTPPPPPTFQNAMVLCALVPTIADAYHRILALVDAEAARAAAARARVPFSLSRCGGGLLSGATCTAGGYEDRLLDPAQWRLAVRALLRADVYGFGCDGGSSSCGDGPGAGLPQAMGLRVLVARMEERSRTRHEELDAMIDAGMVVPGAAGALRPRHTRSLREEGKEPPCRHMIGLAREAVESLVIA